MSQYPEIYVIRHGQTEWNVKGRYQGRKDSPLTETGQVQARAVGQALRAEIGARGDLTAYISPQGRTQASAGLILPGLGLNAHTDPRLQEVEFGEWEGLSWDDIATRWPERAALAETEPFLWHFQSPGGETLVQTQTRTKAFLDDLKGPAVLITHGVTSRVLRALWLGLNEYETAALPGGQGVIYHLSESQGHRAIETTSFQPSKIG